MLITATASMPAQANEVSLQNVFDAGEACAKTVMQKSQELMSETKPGRTTFTSLPLEDARIIQAGTSYSKSSRVRFIPYAESTYLDGGNSGSAWRQCMRDREMPVPEE
ncbi:hypothetical protein [Kushneria phosphatilytica]|uniref:Uncharacterized protein n=1 Tax=Kushneria phosphatilytica TaxID=657387 RepID=A0A1S1NTV9_9GAMM|nr:hypothetical protein [Kushneria phosphatilytica]OHV12999.1 hypothetical protein BH688_03070 [Kushneria phosphatilytica]QEL10869.1 hypothetical protein FY550_06835 [Kushneria phosphatilytica]